MRVLTSLLMVGILVAACDTNSGPSLQAANYNRNCGANTDCITIADVSGCQCPLCNNRAINASDELQYKKDLLQYQSECVDSGVACSNMTCPVVTAYCLDGTCQVQ